MISHLRLCLLGCFQLTSDDDLLTTINTPRLQSLLAYLVLHRAAPQPRRQVAFRLWPDLPEERARANLRKLLLQLRQALPGDRRLLYADDQTLQWRPEGPFTLDVAEFEAQAESPSRWAQAVEWYRGDLLPDCYDDWVALPRERLRQQYLDVLDRLVEQHDRAGEYAAALHYGQRLLQADPLREETYRRVALLHLQNGDRAAALRTYHACAATLQRELDVEPAQATRELYAQLVHGEAPASAPEAAPGPPVAALPLVGRAEEWERLWDIWRESCAGRPQLALLTGEAGIGKTRLAEELLLRLKRQGQPLATAYCYAAEGALPYAPVVGWLRGRPLPRLERVWLSEVARLLPELLAREPRLPAPGPLREGWQRQRLHEALARATLGSGTPLLLLIEDLQWCDRDTLEWLRYLLRFDPQARLLILGTCRPEEMTAPHPLLELQAALGRTGQLSEIRLKALDLPATAQLAAHIAGRELDAGTAARLYRETEGNPLFVVEMMRTGPAGQAPTAPAALPPLVQAVISARLTRLTPEAMELAGAAATIGREFSLDVLEHASGQDEETLVRGLDELWRHQIIRERGEAAYDFSHGLIREAAYAGLSAPRRRLFHRRVAGALETLRADDLDAVSAEVATHLERAGLPQRALGYYRRAAEAARRVYANDQAVAHLGRALELTSPAAWTERYDLLRVRQEVYELLGEREAQAADLEAMTQAAQALGDRSRLAEARWRQAQLLTLTSRFDEAEERAQAALALAEELGDRAGQSAALTAWGAAGYLRGDLPAAETRLQEALRLAQEAGDATEEARAREALLSIQARRGEHEAARAQIEALLQGLEKEGDLVGYAHRLGDLAALLLNQGKIDEAADALRRAGETCRAIGFRHGEAHVLLTESGVALRRGQVGAAIELYRQTIALCAALQESRFAAHAHSSLASVYAWCVGDHESAIREAQAGLDLCRQAGIRGEEFACLMELGRALLAQGQVEQARVHLTAALEGQQASEDLWGEAETRGMLAVLELAQGRPQVALEQIERAESVCRQTGLGVLIPGSLAVRGSALLALARPAEAVAATTAAVAALSPENISSHRVFFRHAQALAAMGQPEQARAALERSYQLLFAMLATLSPEQRQMSLERVPEHRAIVAAWEGGEYGSR